MRHLHFNLVGFAGVGQVLGILGSYKSESRFLLLGVVNKTNRCLLM